MIAPVVVAHVRRWEQHAAARARIMPAHMRTDLQCLRVYVQDVLEEQLRACRERGADWTETQNAMWEGQVRALMELRHELSLLAAAWADGYVYSRASERMLKKGTR